MKKKLFSREIIIYIIFIFLGLVMAHYMNVVASESMEPTLHTGDVVIINYNPSLVQVGDIVVYNATWFSKPVIHRVISKQQANGETVYILKGDNNSFQDPYPVYPNQIISKVVTIENKPIVIPKIGYINLWLRNII